MKKILALIITAALMFTLAACNGEFQVSLDDTSGVSSQDVSGDKPASTNSTVEEPVPSAEPAKGEKIKIVVLGDSIAHGYGLSDLENERYSSLLAEKLKNDYDQVEIYNYGIDGQTGAELAASLKNDPPAELAGADYVIISIGGNNVLQGLISMASNAFKLDANVAQAFSDYVKYLFASASEREPYAYSIDVINDLFIKANEMFNGEEFNSLTEAAAENLKTELPQIVEAIRAVDPDATILIQSIYNPYADIVFNLKHIETPLDLSTRGEASVAKLNAVIDGMADEYGYTVVPVYEAFNASEEKLTNAGFDLTSGEMLNFGVDPHPNALGHGVIADIIYGIIRGE